MGERGLKLISYRIYADWVRSLPMGERGLKPTLRVGVPTVSRRSLWGSVD